MNKAKLIGIAAIALIAGIAGVATLLPHDHDETGHSHGAGDGHRHEEADHEHEHDHDHDEADGEIHLSNAQIAAAGITLAVARPGSISQDLRANGMLVPDADRVTHIVTRVAGIVADLPRRVGDHVAAGDVLAVLDSRDLADATSAYLTALRQEALARTTLERESGLWQKRISAEQDYLDARTVAETARITLQAEYQRLLALGLDRASIDAMPGKAPQTLARQLVKAPLAGQIIEATATRGELIAADKEIFTIADLSRLWVEIPVYASDLPLVQAGQPVRLTGGAGQEGQGEVIFVSPALDPRTGTGRAVAALDNPQEKWRPGDSAAVLVAVGGERAAVIVPAASLQMLEGKEVVFVRTADGFTPQPVQIGRRNSQEVEITGGLTAGTEIAVTGSFVLKAEASRGAAAHAHSH